MSKLKVSKDAIIETVAEAVLSEVKPVPVIDSQNNIIGVLNCSTIIHILFGDKNQQSLNPLLPLCKGQKGLHKK